MLSIKNKHERDDKIQKINNEYIIEGVNIRLKRVTTIVHKWFSKFEPNKIIEKMINSKNWINSEYYGKNEDEIKLEWNKASELGTLLHEDIERFFNNEDIMNENSIEFLYFLDFWEEFKKVNPEYFPYRTEWIIYDEDSKIAGTIDCVLSDKDGNLIILDWKRSKEIRLKNNYQKGYGPFEDMDDCNYNHYTIQLNIYRSILERKYNKKIIAMFIIVLHPKNSGFLMYEIKRKSMNNMYKFLLKEN